MMTIFVNILHCIPVEIHFSFTIQKVISEGYWHRTCLSDGVFSERDDMYLNKRRYQYGS